MLVFVNSHGRVCQGRSEQGPDATHLGGALLFSMVNALQLWIQALNIPIPFDASELLIMMPYVLTIVVLIFSAGRVRTPAALGTPYERGS